MRCLAPRPLASWQPPPGLATRTCASTSALPSCYRKSVKTWIHRATLALAFALAAGACLSDAGCPCGADSSEPYAEHDQSFAGEHTLDNECLCQCGADAPEALPKDNACHAYEEVCFDQAGARHTLTCQ